MRRAPRALAALAAFFAVTAGHRLHSSAQLGTTTSLADRYLALSADPDHHAKKSLSLSAVARTTSRGHAAPQLPGTGEAMQPSSVQLHGKPEKPWEMAAFRHANTFHTLRICNAYPYDKQMRILLNEVELFGGMEYKECDDFANLHLTAGDQLRFLTEVDHHEKTAGIFEISQIPKKYSTTLVLIAQRSNGYSNSMKFESHIFRHDGSAQIAVIDTVRGEPRGKKNKSGPIPGTEVSIEHRGEEVKHSEPEQLPYGSVHKINSGREEDLLFHQGVVGGGVGGGSLLESNSAVLRVWS